jgi:hypothetical protein
LPIPVIEQRLRKLEDIPNPFPKKIKSNITIPIKKPDIAQCHVPKIEFIISTFFTKIEIVV